MKTVSIFVFLLVGLTGTLLAKDWPQWRGKDRKDHSPDTGLLKSWPEGGPARTWIFEDAGLGYSGFSIAGGKLFTMGARQDMAQIICLDTRSGKEIWATDVDVLYTNNWGDGPRATPTLDEDRVYAMSGKGTLVCVKAEDGKVLWKVKMADFGGKLQSWGYTESVLVDGDHVICTPGGKKGSLLALDKMTGKKVWQSESVKDNAQYPSPIVIEHQGERQYVQLFMKSFAGFSAADGKVLWQSEFPGKVAVIPTPIYHEECVYVAAGYGVGCKKVKLGAKDPEVVFQNNVMVNHHGGVILLDDHVYGHSDKGGWTCQNFATGEAVWQDKSFGKGAIGYADGHFYCLEEKTGTVVLIEASTKGWNEKGRFTLSPQTELRKPKGRIWVHPVIVGGNLYLRDQDLIYCYSVKGSS